MLKPIHLALLLFFSLASFDSLAEQAIAPQFAKATFAGGCFWCMEQPFETLAGVIKVVSGYTGGTTVNPTYEDVSGGKTGHFEAVQITYDPRLISYQQLLSVFWRNIDPTNDKGQFCDVGDQYRAAIFYHNNEQKQLAEISKNRLETNKPFPEPVVTLILPASNFYPAEDYHQHYYRKKPFVYKFYRFTCRRDSRLDALWGHQQTVDASIVNGI